MNLYFVVEGKRTEMKVYSEWLPMLLPGYARVYHPSEAQGRHFYLAHGDGVPSLYRFVNNAIHELNSLGTFDFLIVCLDTDDFSAAERQEEVRRNLEMRKAKPQGFDVKVVVQNRCIETWMLGNRKVFQRNPESKQLQAYIKHYNISTDDPELMPAFPDFGNHAAFHHDYLRRMLVERNIFYTKENPRGVVEQSYLQQLLLRTQETNHLASLRDFFDFCKTITP